MATVRLVSTSSVQATTSHHPTHRIELTSCDLFLLLKDPIQKGLLFSKPKPSSQVKDLVHHLKSSLSRTLNFFFPLAGRLATVQDDDNSTCIYYINCNNAGVLFVHAAAENVTICDILEPIYVPSIVHPLFPLNRVKNYEGVSKPLVAVQVTELADGIFIGCTLNHSVGDGTTFWNFINSWSEISRSGFDHISKPPVFEHWFRQANAPISLPLATIKVDVEELSAPPPPLQERVFHFSKQKIASLKEKANTAAGVNNISSLQSLLAHIWRSVTRNRKLDSEQETNFNIMIGLRSRFFEVPPAQEYFGNAIQVGTLTLKAREVLEHGLGYTALLLNKVVACFTEDKIRNDIEYLTQNPKVLTGKTLRNACFTSSSPRHNVYGNDFGWGKPIAVRSGIGNKIDGKLTIFPGVEDGSIDIELCLAPETFQAMGNDSEFMDAVTI